MIYKKEEQADGSFKILEISEFGDRYVDNDQPDYLDYSASNEVEVVPYIAPLPESLEACQARLIATLSQDSFNAKDLLVPAYREDNAIRHKLATGEEMYTEYSLAQIDQLSVDCRAEFYRVKGLIESATTTEDAETSYNSKNFPTTL